MNWTQFLLGVIAVYGIYYALNVLYDLFIHRRAPTTGDGGNELVFDEDSPPEKVIPKPSPKEHEPTAKEGKAVISSGPLQSTGGITIKELVSFAQNNVIEYTKAIPY
ncbi:hypothetical protein ACR777_14895 [Sphingobacterium spiritivorum]|uniref:hypothetical protein n=1 Tax=Sphingobacterium TaxID=28453 RepID=UPI0016000650|nr:MULTISPECIES: hypothetical protein [Sphingobacterium]MBB1646402.1 hypothetical protein [Sphingobacterium sp. UME9]